MTLRENRAETFADCANTRFSALLPVYAGEQPQYLSESLDSVRKSSWLPSQVVVVEDGPLTPALERVLREHAESLPLHRVRRPRQGLPAALNAGLAECEHEIVARCDADDINLPQRFKQQLQLLAARPEVGVVGANVREFDAQALTPMRERRVPCEPARISRYARTRNPLNHPSVMYRKSVIQQVGGYSNLRGFEDYALWLRCLVAGVQIVNLEQPLVHVRAGTAMLARRRGLAYARAELAMAWYAHRIGFLGLGGTALFIASRVPLRLVPAPALASIYRNFLRAQR